jgi:hypothetical protein
MALARKFLTVGNKVRYTLDYSYWLEEGVTLATFTAVTTDTSVTITDVAVLPSGHAVLFVAGGTLNQPFTVSVQAVDSRGEIKNDVIEFVTHAP